MIPVLAAASGKVATLPDVSITHSLLQMVIALAVVVACIWGLSKLLARLRGGAPTSRRRPAGGLEVVGRQSLGKDLSIATVRWGGREVLVGISGSTITFLSDPGSGQRTGEGAVAEPPRRQPATERAGEIPDQPQRSLLDALRDATLRR